MWRAAFPFHALALAFLLRRASSICADFSRRFAGVRKRIGARTEIDVAGEITYADKALTLDRREASSTEPRFPMSWHSHSTGQ